MNTRGDQDLLDVTWFNSPQGRDCPDGLFKAGSKPRLCYITLKDRSGYMQAMVQVCLDSQQPQIIIGFGRREQGYIIFPLKNCELVAGMQEDPVDFGCSRSQFQSENPFLKDMPMAYYYSITPRTDPVVIQPSLMADSDGWEFLLRTTRIKREFTIWCNYGSPSGIKRLLRWVGVLYNCVYDGIPDGDGQAFWWYRNYQRDLSIPPTPPWLSQVGDNQHPAEWLPRVPYFLDDDERRNRLIFPSLKEWEAQVQQLAIIYSPERRHRACFVQNESFQCLNSHYLNIRIRPTGQNLDRCVPDLAAGQIVKFKICDYGREYQQENLVSAGMVIESDSDADLTLLVMTDIPPGHASGDTVDVVLSVEPKLLPIELQIKALDSVSRTHVFGDREGDERNGFSLHRTMLAHGSELRPGTKHHFIVNVRSMSPLPMQAQAERMEYIKKHFPLNDDQQLALERSLTRIVCGVHLVQGATGTGKSRVALVTTLILAVLEIPVLLAAKSDRGVDNLTRAVAEALKRHPRIQSWAGQLVRFHSYARQVAELRSGSPCPTQSEEEADILRPYDIRNVALQYAMHNRRQDRRYDQLIDILRQGRQRLLFDDEITTLTERYEHVVQDLLFHCRIVATSLCNAAHVNLRGTSGFKPEFLVCDESGQGLEGYHAIALSITSLRAVILLGDPMQIAPTFLSEGRGNEGIKFLKRPLMGRLCESGYPCTILTINHRNNDAILRLSQEAVYESYTALPVQAHRDNNAPDRVGSVWDAFTHSRHHFYATRLGGARQIFISVDDVATRHGGCNSWSNGAQVDVARDILAELYAYTSSDGVRILPKDVMIISPYKEQRDLVYTMLREQGLGFCSNLTIDAAEGRESPFVIFLMTLPSTNALNVGSMANINRLNLALTRAQKVLLIVGNLLVWNRQTMWKLTRDKRNRLLCRLLKDVSNEGHTLTWVGRKTAQERDAPQNVQYVFHDSGIRQQQVVPPVAILEETHSVQAPCQTACQPEHKVSFPFSTLESVKKPKISKG